MSSESSSYKRLDKAYHDVIGGEYHEVVVEPRAYANDLLFRPIERRIRPGKRFLDVGCGTGHMLLRFGDRFENITGVDHSEQMLSGARANAAKSGLNVEFVQDEVTSFLGGDDSRFDLVTAVGFLHHIKPEEIPAIIALIAARLEEGGQLVIAEPIELESEEPPAAVSRWNETSIVKGLGYSVHADDPEEAPIPLALLEKAFADNGLRIAASKRAWDLFPRHVPPSLWDRVMLNYLSFRYRGDGIVYAALLEKAG